MEAGKISCILVKDLSRFGRDYIDVGRYLERIFPAKGVRFIALGDQIDSQKSAYDLMLPLKNVFNQQYAQDISQKVKAAVKIKQESGQFIGAFASYGYEKSPAYKHRLIIDPVAAAVVRRIFSDYEAGRGKIAIAKQLNQEGIPSPSQYKEQSGQRYCNGRSLGSSTYWTYATIHRMLKNPIYAGDMQQGKTHRQGLHGRAKQREKDKWILVENTHEAIIEREQWQRVQALLEKNTRSIAFGENVSLFAGFLRCGDCGRAMAKTKKSSLCCGSYKRYGADICTPHAITCEALEQLVLGDINHIMSNTGNMKELAKQAEKRSYKSQSKETEAVWLSNSLARVQRLKKRSYEDYAEGILSKTDYQSYQKDYARQEVQLKKRQASLNQTCEKEDRGEKLWLTHLLAEKTLLSLDRLSLAELVQGIQIFENRRIEISYRFKDPQSGG